MSTHTGTTTGKHMSTKERPTRPRRLFRSGHAYADIQALLSDVEHKGLCLDLPAGKGVNTGGIEAAGFEPVAADLFPEAAAAKTSRCVRADFNEPLPFENEAFAAVLCSEGIEHCPVQLQLIREFARVLKPGGTLVLTTPNVLNFRARLSYMLNGHSSFARSPITEVTQVWGQSEDSRIYVGHVYLVSYFALRFMLKLAGFDRISVASAKYSTSAALLSPFLWLPVRLATARLLRRVRDNHDPATYAEIMSHVMSADMLLGKKLILIARKQSAERSAPEEQAET